MEQGLDIDSARIEYMLGALKATVDHIQSDMRTVKSTIDAIKECQEEVSARVLAQEEAVKKRNNMINYWIDFVSKMWPIIIVVGGGAFWIVERLSAIPSANQMHDIIRAVQHVAS